MHQEIYLPEGVLLNTERNKKHTATLQSLINAMETNTIIEGRAEMCDSNHNLIVDVNGYRGFIPRNEAAIGIEEGETREIAVISRVGKPVAALVTGVDTETDGEIKLLLSRRKAQQLVLKFFLSNLVPGDVIPARVTHLEPFGAFLDIGCGNISLMGIENLSVSRIAHPKNRFEVGQDVYAAVLSIDTERRRITLTHRELLGTWEQNTEGYEPGQTVRGIVRGVEDYGVFVELKPNLSGLAEYRPDINEGDHVSVFIKNITPEKMKIKLIIIDVFKDRGDVHISQKDYFITGGRIKYWRYSPESCERKRIETEFK